MNSFFFSLKKNSKEEILDKANDPSVDSIEIDGVKFIRVSKPTPNEPNATTLIVEHPELLSKVQHK
jgi:hypothetical protein